MRVPWSVVASGSMRISWPPGGAPCCLDYFSCLPAAAKQSTLQKSGRFAGRWGPVSLQPLVGYGCQCLIVRCKGPHVLPQLEDGQHVFKKKNSFSKIEDEQQDRERRIKSHRTLAR